MYFLKTIVCFEIMVPYSFVFHTHIRAHSMHWFPHYVMRTREGLRDLQKRLMNGDDGASSDAPISSSGRIDPWAKSQGAGPRAGIANEPIGS
jgi:hypothetical protein